MVYVLEPANKVSPLETYMVVYSYLVSASSHGSKVQTPFVTPMFSALWFPWKPLESRVARLGEDTAAAFAILYSFLHCLIFLFPFTTPPLPPAFLQRKVFLVSLSAAQPDIPRQEKVQSSESL